MSTLCQWGMRQTAELENEMTSVERVVEYANLLPEEATSSEPAKSRDDWPQHGEIIFTNLSLRYAENGEKILKNLNFHIRSREKIGIVGRTGAGKSSIIQAIFRLAVNEGLIEIDGVDISTIGLNELRKKIAIIPQEPILFSGTIRENLDPFKEKSDDELWKALEQVNLILFKIMLMILL